MKVIFSTHQHLHRSKLARVRQRLLGSTFTSDTVPSSSRGEVAVVHPTLTKKTSKFSVLTKRVVRALLLTVTGLGLLSVVVLLAPKIYYLVVPVETQILEIDQEATVQGGDFDQALVDDETDSSLDTPGRKYVPPVNPNLPEGNWIVIPSIGVRTELRETEDPQEALEKGVWQVPEFGDPGDVEVPLIVAAHRYGWQWWWQDDYWKYNSFYLLPDTQPGDRVEIIADQRMWVYEIYAAEEGEEISDYSGDMILYTCKFISSPVRHFRYAKLIDPTLNSQSSS